MKKKIRFTTDPEEIKKHLEKLYDKIDMQILLHQAHANQKNSILSKQEIDKLNKYNLNNNISGS